MVGVKIAERLDGKPWIIDLDVLRETEEELVEHGAMDMEDRIEYARGAFSFTLVGYDQGVVVVEVHFEWSKN